MMGWHSWEIAAYHAGAASPNCRYTILAKVRLSKLPANLASAASLTLSTARRWHSLGHETSDFAGRWPDDGCFSRRQQLARTVRRSPIPFVLSPSNAELIDGDKTRQVWSPSVALSPASAVTSVDEIVRLGPSFVPPYPARGTKPVHLPREGGANLSIARATPPFDQTGGLLSSQKCPPPNQFVETSFGQAIGPGRSPTWPASR